MSDESDNRIDELADQFEATWRSGRRISADEFLSAVEVPAALLDVNDVLTELRLVERELHQKYRQSSLPLSSDFESPSRIGNYVILGLIGQGGMGKLYRARQVLLDKIVAIKLLPHAIAQDPKAIERFERELKLIGKLSHPNIVHALYAEHIAGKLLLVMEYVDGENLQQILASGKRFPIDDAVAIIRQVALGLQCAFEQNIIHRDIKPANIMMTGGGEAKILDFGLGKFHGELPLPVNEHESGQLTQDGTTIGTVDFLSPEQWDDPGSVNIQTDIYGLGCTFYTIVVGKVPYPSDKYPRVSDKRKAHRHIPMPSFSSNGIPASPVIEAILQKMCAKDLEDRYATPQELLDALNAYRGGVPIVSPIVPRKGGLSRRHLLIAGGIAVATSFGLPPLFQSFFGQKQESSRGEMPPSHENGEEVGEKGIVLAPISEVLAHRYRGDLRTARRMCREWIEDRTRSALDIPEQREQVVIMKELFADCTLYDPNVRKYDDVEEAGELYVKTIALTDSPEKKDILNSKRAILLMISGNPSAGQRALDIGMSKSTFKSDGENGKSFLFLEVAKGIGNFYCAETHAGRQASLRRVLDMFRLNMRPIASQPCDLEEMERCELQLLCIRQLLETALKAGDFESARQDTATYLDPILRGMMAGQDDRRPYLRRDFDLAIRCNTLDLLKQAEYIYISRRDRTAREGLAHLLFYFTDQGGFAIFLPSDLSGGSKFDLTWTRNDLRLRRTNHQQDSANFLLPEQLVTFVQAEWDAGRKVTLSWSDEMCFLDRDMGLSLDDWAFESQLKLHLLVGTAR